MEQPQVRQKCSCGAEAQGPSAFVKVWWDEHKEWCSWAAEFIRWRDKKKLEVYEKQRQERDRNEGILNR